MFAGFALASGSGATGSRENSTNVATITAATLATARSAFFIAILSRFNRYAMKPSGPPLVLGV
jgi:hypothetical protein